MGFGTSGSALVVFVALFIAMNSLYTATANSVEAVSDAREDRQDHHRTVQETQVTVADATWNATSNSLTVRVDNTGGTELSVDRVDVVVDGEYLDSSDFERRTVEGRTTDIWRPGERLVLEDTDTVGTAPDRVKFVSGPGVADTATVVEVSG